MELVQIEPKRPSLFGWQGGPAKRRLPESGHQQRAEQIGGFCPDDPPGKGDQQNPATADQGRNVQTLRLAQDEAQRRSGGELTELVEDRADDLHPFGLRDVLIPGPERTQRGRDGWLLGDQMPQRPVGQELRDLDKGKS